MFEIACVYFWYHQRGRKAPGGVCSPWHAEGGGAWGEGVTAGSVSHGVHWLQTLLGARGTWGCLGGATGKGDAGRGKAGVSSWLYPPPSPGDPSCPTPPGPPSPLECGGESFDPFPYGRQKEQRDLIRCSYLTHRRAARPAGMRSKRKSRAHQRQSGGVSRDALDLVLSLAEL